MTPYVGFLQGSVLNAGTLLHHTGSMWQAIRNAGSPVRPGGSFAIAIYKRLEYHILTRWRGSHEWLRTERLYNRLEWPAKRVLAAMAATRQAAGAAAHRQLIGCHEFPFTLPKSAAPLRIE